MNTVLNSGGSPIRAEWSVGIPQLSRPLKLHCIKARKHMSATRCLHPAFSFVLDGQYPHVNIDGGMLVQPALALSLNEFVAYHIGQLSCCRFHVQERLLQTGTNEAEVGGVLLVIFEKSKKIKSLLF